MVKFPGRDMSVTEAFRALELLETLVLYSGSPADGQKLALVRLILRRQTMVLAACSGMLRARKDLLPTEREIYAAIQGLAPIPADQGGDQGGDQVELKPVPQPGCGQRDVITHDGLE